MDVNSGTCGMGSIPNSAIYLEDVELKLVMQFCSCVLGTKIYTNTADPTSANNGIY
jgi:hypothetical protein